MKTLEDNHFDLIITDPPYGILNNAGWIKQGRVKQGVAYTNDYTKDNFEEWDKEIPSKEYFKEMIRVSKNQIIFGGNYMTDYLPSSSCWIVWDKDNGDCDFADCELAWTSFNTAVRKFKYRWWGMLQEEMGLFKEKRFHPTQKPVALGRWLLDKYSKEGDKIFDPFAGSGSFLVACKQKGYNFVGCELEKKYVDIIKERLQQKTLLESVQEKGLK